MIKIGNLVVASRNEINDLADLAVKRSKARTAMRKYTGASRGRYMGARPLI